MDSEKNTILNSLASYVTNPEEGCDAGVVRITYPEMVVNTPGYYTWWAIAGCCISAHRLYLGQWAIPLAITILAFTATILFVIWGAVLLFSINGNAVLVFSGFLFCSMAVAMAWLFDMYRGCALVDRYNEDLELAILGEEAKVNSDELYHKMIQRAVFYEKNKLSKKQHH